MFQAVGFWRVLLGLCWRPLLMSVPHSVTNWKLTGREVWPLAQLPIQLAVKISAVEHVRKTHIWAFCHLKKSLHLIFSVFTWSVYNAQ